LAGQSCCSAPQPEQWHGRGALGRRSLRAGADKDDVAGELLHEGGVGQSGHAAAGELHDEEAAELLGLHHQIE
jgi:hypothetical protein